MTYNVHRCVGRSRRPEPQRIADVIAGFEPDIVALQELDVGRARTGGVDQARSIADRLGMDFVFHPALRTGGEQYGEAVLSARPIRLVKGGELPTFSGRLLSERRGALWVAIDLGGVELQVVNTHLGLYGRERTLQAETLLGRGWLGHPDWRDPAILLGDFNAVPGSPAYRRLEARLSDAQAVCGRPRPTYPAGLPLLRIDHVFCSRSVAARRCQVPRSPFVKSASDHLPLVVDVEVAGQGRG